MRIHGPKGSLDIYEATKTFIVLHEFNVIGHDADDDVYDDQAITVQHVKLASTVAPSVAPDPVYSLWRPGKSAPVILTPPWRILGHGWGIMVSVLAFYSENLSLNPAGYLICTERQKKLKQKARVGPS